MRVLARGMADQRRELAVAGLLGAIASASAVALLGASGWLISRAAEMPPVLLLGVAAVLVRTFALSRAVFRYAERLVGHDAAFRGLTGLRVTVYEHLERLAPAGLAAFGRGDLLSRLVADVDAALDLPLRVILPWAQAILVSAATVLFLAFLLPGAGLVVGLLAVCALAVIPWIVARAASSAEARLAPARADVAAAVVQVLDATADIAAFGAASSASSHVRDLDDRLTRLNSRESFALGLGGGLTILVQGVAVSASLGLGVVAVSSGRLEPVWLAVAALLPLALFDVLGGLPSSALAYQRLRGSAKRLAEVELASAPIIDPMDPVALPARFEGVELHEVSASWPTAAAGSSTLRGVSLRVARGERVGIVGPSGAGKSTLAAVMMGFLPYDGIVTVSGVDARGVAGDDLRDSIGLLSQQAHMFDTTIADNVRLGNPSASDDEVADALATAQLTAWIDTLPNGTDTQVGVAGIAVSGGERQRLALARLLLARRPFVILDEPTEHLDAATAAALAVTLADALRGSTVLIVTHRLADLVDVDRIIELQDGAVTATGSHEELFRAGGWYAQQWHVESDRRQMATLLDGLPVGVAVPGPADRDR
ncbi:MAG: thiol reductant ABC exporter subunit CydC [bacterium]|nr:thiol reductant ABC exporter subunit CydC [bacterium]